MASAACTVKDGSSAAVTTPPYALVTPGNAVTIALADATGNPTWSISCVYADDTTAPATINAGLTVNGTAKTATFTAPAAGKAMIFRSVVNGGLLNGQAYAPYVSTFKVATATAGGLIVAATNEQYEHDAVYGWTGVLNAAVRGYGATASRFYPMPSTALLYYPLNDSTAPAGSTYTNQGSLGSAGNLTIGNSGTGLQWGVPSPIGPMFSSVGSPAASHLSTASLNIASTLGSVWSVEGFLQVADQQGAVYKTLFGNSSDILIGIDSNQLASVTMNGATSSSTLTAPSGYAPPSYRGFVHYMATYDGANIRLYLDAILFATLAKTGALLSSASAVHYVLSESGNVGRTSGCRVAVHTDCKPQSYAAAVVRAANGWP